jgi:hypothetical protein
VQLFRRLKPQPKTEPFTLRPAAGRSICAWAGTLPKAPYCRHFLSVFDIAPDSLRGNPGEFGDYAIALLHPNNNIEIVMGYRYNDAPKHYHQLYRAQFDLRLPKTSLTQTSIRVGRSLARYLQQIDDDRLLRYSEDWTTTVDAVYRVELRHALRAINTTPEQFWSSPDYFRCQGYL